MRNYSGLRIAPRLALLVAMLTPGPALAGSMYVDWSMDLTDTRRAEHVRTTADRLAEARAASNDSGIRMDTANGGLRFSAEQDLAGLRAALFRKPIAKSLRFLGGPTELSIDVAAANELLTIRLQARTTTGYRWMLIDDDSGYQQQGEPQWAMRQQGIGTPAIQTFKLRATAKKGSAPLRFVYRRPFEKQTGVRAQMRLSIPHPDAKKAVIDLTDPAPVKPFTPPPSSNNKTIDPNNLPAAPETSRLRSTPADYDSRNAGIVPDVRDQGSCGSCWSFGTVGVMEIALRKAGEGAIDLSEQFLVSCNRDGWGCDGGLTASKYHYDTLARQQTAPGAVLETVKPYTESNGSCTGDYAHPYRASSWQFLTGSEWTMPTNDQIKEAIMTYGAITAGVCADAGFSSYRSGVYAPSSNSCGGSTNHQIVLVGWDDNTRSWILRNSWGTSWGENGYMRIRYDQTGSTSRVGEGSSWVDIAGSVDVHVLRVNPQGTGSGTVSSTPSGISCGDDCAESYSSTTTVTLTARADSGSTFAGWGGPCSGTGSCRLRMSTNRNVTATFNGLPSGSIADAVDNTGLSWTTGGDASWLAQTAITHDGTDAAQSGNIGNAQSAWLQTSVTGPGTLSYFWKVSSESGWDFLRVAIDGIEQSGSISGETHWARRNLSIGAGSHTLRWSYTKDGSVSNGEDAGWIDQVVFTPGAGEYPLSVDRSGSGSGTVSSMPAGIDCGSDCAEDYAAGTRVTLTALATGGSSFTGWSGACTGTGPCVVEMSAARSVTARFSSGSADPVSCQCAGAYSVGDRVIAMRDRPAGANGISAGDRGTVVCGAYGSPGLLISWDGWQAGHHGNGYCACPFGGLSDTSGWYVECADVIPDTGDQVSLQEALDDPAHVFTSGGSAHWIGQTAITNDGTDAGQSGGVTDGQSSWVETTVQGPGTLSFYWKVSSEAGFDFLTFQLDGTPGTAPISGDVDWQQQLIGIPAGTHTLRWVYEKDYSLSSGADTAWVDQVAFVPTTALTLGEALDNTSQTFTTGGDAPWYGEQTPSAHDERDSAHSGGLTDSQSSWVQTTITGPGTLSFYWTVSSESGFDYLRFYIDGVEQTGSSISGEVGWTRQRWGIPRGQHTVRWAYTKDASVSRGADAGRLDRVMFSSGGNQNHQLRVTRLGTGFARIISSPAGIDCGERCSHSFVSGTEIRLNITDAIGSIFGGWGGACSGTGVCIVDLDEPKQVTATFSADGPREPVSCRCDGRFAVGDRVLALIDDPSGATGIQAGTRGSIVCGGGEGTDGVLVSWDDWQFGHDGNGACACPVTSLQNDSGWYVGCDQIRTLDARDLSVTPVIGPGGTVVPDHPQAVDSEDTATFVVIPQDGYILSDIAGTCPTGSLEGDRWTTGPITRSCTVRFQFFCPPCLPSRAWRAIVR